ncbi:MAG: LamG domain-containing protein [bacterium]|nr:LamG domain-containing protein [bacterium]
MKKCCVSVVVGATVVAAVGRAALLSYDPLTLPATTHQSSLHNSTNGYGWRAGWEVQTPSNPGYAITNAPALSYSASGKILITNGNIATGGDAWTSAGRMVDVRPDWEPDTVYTPYRRMVNWQAQVGKDGTELWFSCLARQRVNDEYEIEMHAQNIPWYGGQNPYVRIDVSGGQWRLSGKDPNGNGTSHSTGITRDLDTTYLMVVRMNFAASSDTIDLYVNPSDLGGTPPATPSASITLSDFYWRSIRWYPGAAPNTGYLDEIRVGESFADVTPMIPEPGVAVALVLVAWLAQRRR